MAVFNFIFLITSVFASSWSEVDGLVKSNHRRLFPEASLIVGNKQVVVKELHPGSSSERVYDIASLTKVVATATAIMILQDRGLLSVSDPVKNYIPEFSGKDKDGVLIEDLLRHRAGLLAGKAPLSGEQLLDYIKRIASSPLSYSPRSKVVYSDLSAILLGHIVEVVSSQKLDEFVHAHIFGPLGMKQTSMRPDLMGFSCALTGKDRSCRPHDPTANHFFPVAIGNAGVFSTSLDLSLFAQMMLGKGELNGVRILSEESVKQMTELPRGVTRGLGWDLLSEYSSAPRGAYFSEGVSYGHTGYTGTTLWIDPKCSSYYVFLSNRVYLGDAATKKPFSAFRKALSSGIGKVLYFQQNRQ